MTVKAPQIPHAITSAGLAEGRRTPQKAPIGAPKHSKALDHADQRPRRGPLAGGRRRPLRFARPTGFAALRGRREATAGFNPTSSTHTNNQHEVGPVQGSALGPVQVAAPTGRREREPEERSITLHRSTYANKANPAKTRLVK